MGCEESVWPSKGCKAHYSNKLSNAPARQRLRTHLNKKEMLPSLKELWFHTNTIAPHPSQEIAKSIMSLSVSLQLLVAALHLTNHKTQLIMQTVVSKLCCTRDLVVNGALKVLCVTANSHYGISFFGQNIGQRLGRTQGTWYC